MTEIIESGALARITVSSSTPWSNPYEEGKLVTIEDYVPEDNDGPAYYCASDDRGSYNLDILPEHVELVMTAKEMSERTLPSVVDVVSFLGLELLSSADGFEIDETEHDDNVVHLYGSTRDGLKIGIDVQVTAIYEVDKY